MPRTKAATVDRFGRILIPKGIRERAGLREGSELEIIADERGLRLVTCQGGVLLREVAGVLVATGQAVGDLFSAVRNDREKRLRKLVGRRG